MTEEREGRDRSLFQPLQMAGGAAGAALLGGYGGKLAARLAFSRAARFGRRAGAFVRLAGRVAGAAGHTMPGAFASGVARHQSRMAQRIATAGARAGATTAGVIGGSAAGDFAGDYAARRATGAHGEDDEYRHASLLGMAGGAAGGILGHIGVGGMRRMRWARPMMRRGATVLGATGGAVAGEASGNVHDERFGVSDGAASVNRRLYKAMFGGRGPSELSSGWSDPQKGYASPFQQSWLPASGKQAPSRLMAQDSATGGSTMATGESAGFQRWKKDQKGNAWSNLMSRFNVGGSMGGSFFNGMTGSSPFSFERSAPSGGLAKRDLSDAEHQQRVAAGKASAAKRKSGGVGGPRLKQPSWYRQTRIDPNDPDFDGTGKAQDATTEGGAYRHIEMRPQRPAAMADDEYHALARYAGETTRGIRDKVLTDGKNKRMIPDGTDPKTAKLAYEHARKLALHDVGLADMRFRMTPETVEQLQPLHPFIWHARRAQANALRQGKPGAWAPFRQEFGKPFKDGRTYAFDGAGHKAGDEKKRFYRHLQLVKAAGASGRP